MVPSSVSQDGAYYEDTYSSVTLIRELSLHIYGVKVDATEEEEQAKLSLQKKQNEKV